MRDYRAEKGEARRECDTYSEALGRVTIVAVANWIAAR